MSNPIFLAVNNARISPLLAASTTKPPAASWKSCVNVWRCRGHVYKSDVIETSFASSCSFHPSARGGFAHPMICTHSSYKPENASFWEDSIKTQVSETCWLFPHVLGITSLFFQGSLWLHGSLPWEQGFEKIFPHRGHSFLFFQCFSSHFKAYLKNRKQDYGAAWEGIEIAFSLRSISQNSNQSTGM